LTEQETHNPKVACSNPSRPMSKAQQVRRFRMSQTGPERRIVNFPLLTLSSESEKTRAGTNRREISWHIESPEVTGRHLQPERGPSVARANTASRADVAVAVVRQEVAPFRGRQVAVRDSTGLCLPGCGVDIPDDAGPVPEDCDHLLAVREERSPPARFGARERRADELARVEIPGPQV